MARDATGRGHVIGLVLAGRAADCTLVRARAPKQRLPEITTTGIPDELHTMIDDDEHELPRDPDDESGVWDDEDSDSGEWGGPTHVFFENEPLIRALNDPRRSENDADAAQLLFRGLVDATLIALVPDEIDLPKPEEAERAGEMQLGLLTVQHAEIDGDIIPMFTDEGALSDFSASDGGRYIALAVRDLFPLLATGGPPPNIVVNPGGREALLLSSSMVLDIVQAVRGYRPITIKPGTEVQVDLPDDPLPSESAEAVIGVLTQQSSVVRCWELQWRIDGVHEQPTLVLAVEFDESIGDDDRRSAFESIQDGIEPELDDLEQPIDLVDFARQHELFGAITATATPLYQRDA